MIESTAHVSTHWINTNATNIRTLLKHPISVLELTQKTKWMSYQCHVDESSMSTPYQRSRVM